MSALPPKADIAFKSAAPDSCAFAISDLHLVMYVTLI